MRIVVSAAASACVSPPCVAESRNTRGRSWWSPPSRMMSRLPTSALTENPGFATRADPYLLDRFEIEGGVSQLAADLQRT